MLCNNFVQGRRLMSNNTIQSEDGSYVIECVDIYKQPAFSHPLLKNHTIQTRPSSSPIGFEEGSTYETFQSWNKYGECPKGTIPIVKSQLFNSKKTTRSFLNITHRMQSASSLHEYAIAALDGGPYYGARATFNVWSPTTDPPGEFSSSQVVLVGLDPALNFLQAGWQVHPSVTGVNTPTLFTFWAADSEGKTGCYNLKCPGFVQISTKLAVGADLSPVSTYNAKQFQIQLTIHKDQSGGNWWLRFANEYIGYWPASIFTSLTKSSSQIHWGGEIVNTRPNGKHTSTQMGSGHFSTEGFGKAAYVANLGYFDNSGAIITPDQRKVIQFVTTPACYNFKYGPRGTSFGLHFYFGGPGFSPQCP
ncbi:hypothetical protein M5689_020614 [Euphorbia peplus]|nr:hypothetical protein M5689_020614 [Euphorbia peplus]